MSLNRKLLKLCKTALDSVILDPSVNVRRISIKRLKPQHCLQTRGNKCLLVKVFTNDASMLRGAPDTYKGSYKERVEGIIDHFVQQSDPRAHAHLEIIGPDTGSVDRLIPIAKLLRKGKICADSPIVQTGKRYKIDYALIRGRHLIGPCPTIPAVLQGIVKHKDIRTALDMFAGTGVATKAICMAGTPQLVTIVEKDESKVARMSGHLEGFPVEIKTMDAFEFQLEHDFDLVVADPYFEETIDFLDKKLPQIAHWAGIFVLSSGRIEDLTWNRKVQQKLIMAGLNVTKHTEFGEVVFVARKSAP
jgi:16S rRNA G966 N2-methylase RsmD